MRKTAAVGLTMVACALAACGADGAAGPAAARVSVTHLSVEASRPAAAPDPAAPTSAPGVKADGGATASSAGAVPSGTAPGSTIPHSTVPGGTQGRPVRIMPLGDSLTQGGNAEDPTTPQSYRGALESRLREAGYRFDLVGSDQTPAIGGTDPDNEGHGGFTIGPDASSFCEGCPPANLTAHLDEWVPQAQPDVIIVLAGVNDLFPIETRTNGALRPVRPEEAPAKLTALVDRLAQLAPAADIVIATYPPMPLFMGADDAGRAAFAALNEAARAAGARGGRFHTAPLAAALFADWLPEDTIADGVHPSPSGAAKIADVLAGVLAPVLDQRR